MIKNKKNIIPVIFLVFTILLVIFSTSNLSAAKKGLKLWANNIVPALLPFFIATEMLSYTDIATQLSKFLNPIMKPLFNIPRMCCVCLYSRDYKWLPCWCKNCFFFKRQRFVLQARS